VRCEVFTAVKVEFMVFWVVAPPQQWRYLLTKTSNS